MSEQVQTEKRIPAYLSSPGKILLRELKARGLNWQSVEKKINLDRRFPNLIDLLQVIEGRKPITQDIAEALHREFGISAQFWLNLQTNYFEWLEAKAQPHGEKTPSN